MAAEARDEGLRVVLLGKTGVGKSSTGNTLLGREAFQVARGMASGTERCQYADAVRHGVQLSVTDTPGLCDTHRPESEVLDEVAKSVLLAAPGPHVVLMVLRADRRFTEEEYQAYSTLKHVFEEGVCKHMIVLFTAADALADTPEEQRKILKRELERCPQQLRQILQDVDDRVVAVSNRASDADKDTYAREVIQAVQALVTQNAGRYYTSNILKRVASFKEPMIEKLMESKRYVNRYDAEKDINADIAGGGHLMVSSSGIMQTIRDLFRKLTSTQALSKLCSVM